jgi:stage V sporulation protein D (sporulation-specific penicillin-binding protein)
VRRRKRQRQAVEGRPEVVLARRSVGREKILFYVCFALAAYLVWRLYDVQIIQGPMLAAKALGQQSAIFSVSAQRGAIYTTDGVLLARSLPSRSVYASPDAIGDLPRTAGIVAHVLGEPTATAIAQIKEMPHYHVIAWKIPDPQARALLALDLPGISVEQETSGKRFLPSGRLASTLLGFVGRDDDGLEGIEYEFDSLLRGSAGRMTMETDQFARALPFAKPHYVIPPKTGDSLVLTIDSYLQYAAEHVLAKTVKQFSAMSGVAIIMDPYSGALLAVANVPNYDVRSFQRFTPDQRRDRAVTDAYEPGSTFKLITATAALESHKVTTASMFPARDALEVGGSVIHNAEDGLMAGSGGSESLETIIALSHNVGAAEVGLRIGPHAMFKTMRAFGFGDPTEVDLPGENPGILPPLDSWSATSLPTMSFGHGIAITPIALARAYAAIANGGVLVRPRILGEIVGPDGNVIYRYGREVERRVMSQATSKTLCSFLRQVVLHGTGNPTAQVAGYTTAGKTGTAQVAEGGGYLPGAYVASFVGFVPYEHPRFLILVKVERPRGEIYGSEVAAPAFAELARAAMLHAGYLPTPPTPPPAPHVPLQVRTVRPAARSVDAPVATKQTTV